LVIFGDFWRFLAIFGDFWRFLAIFGDFWSIIRPPARDFSPKNGYKMSTEILRFFVYKHLETPAQRISAQFCEVAHWVAANVHDCEERSVALRKLLEAKDAAVRAHFCGDSAR
jgi:hypothetical protein